MGERRPESMERITTPELAKAFIDEQVDALKKQIGDKKVLLALSGGVDSSVVADLELINVSGITFVDGEDGIPKGLCNAKELSYVTSAGGFIGENNFGFDYVKALASNFWGVDKINFYKAEGLDIIGNNPDKIIKEQIKKYFG